MKKIFVILSLFFLFPSVIFSEPIPKRINDCIAYITTEFEASNSEKKISIVPIGTAFFVSYDYDNKKNNKYAFLVTAKHVILDGNGKVNKKLFLRINDPNSKKAKDFNVLQNRKWFFHENDESVDLAVTIPGSVGGSVLSVTRKNFFSDEIKKKNKIGIGDDVFYIGLLPYHSGKEKIFPITRFGRLAMTSDERTVDNKYLHFIDADNMPGHSGSPVFLWATATRHSSGIVAGPRIFALYGIVSNILEYKKTLKFIVPKETKQSPRPIPIDMRSGGVTGVVPVKYLVDILESTDFHNYVDSMK